MIMQLTLKYFCEVENNDAESESIITDVTGVMESSEHSQHYVG